MELKDYQQKPHKAGIQEQKCLLFVTQEFPPPLKLFNTGADFYLWARSIPTQIAFNSVEWKWVYMKSVYEPGWWFEVHYSFINWPDPLEDVDKSWPHTAIFQKLQNPIKENAGLLSYIMKRIIFVIWLLNSFKIEKLNATYITDPSLLITWLLTIFLFA